MERFGGQYYRLRQSDAHAWVEAEITPGEWLRLDPTQIVPSAAQGFRTRQFEARNIETAPGWRGVMQRGLQRADAFIVRLNSDIVLYDEEARRELLSGTVLGRLDILCQFLVVWQSGLYCAACFMALVCAATRWCVLTKNFWLWRVKTALRAPGS